MIACIEDQDIIDKILAHLHDKEPATSFLPLLTPPSRAPPETWSLFAGKDFAWLAVVEKFLVKVWREFDGPVCARQFC